MIYDKILAESKRLDKKIESIQTHIASLPDGKLLCAANNKHINWYLSKDGSATYLSKKERPLAKHLAHKKFLSLQLKHLKQEQTAIQFYLNHHNQNSLQEELDFFYAPEYHELLSEIHQPLSEELEQWMHADYERNLRYPENLAQPAFSGNLVRSKSEVLIDMILCRYQIPFRYECALRLGELCLYPNFTIRHPKTGEIFYWEHFGMLDNESYSKNVGSKIQTYISHGIYPSIQLITTFESKDHPLSIKTIEEIVEHYFL